MKETSNLAQPQREVQRYDDKDHFEYESLDQFLASEINQGISSVRYGNVHIDLFVEDRNCETTVVVFHTALNPSMVTTPVFVGRGLLEGLDVNVICCSDPALELGVGLGWFIGKKGLDFQEDLTRAIGHVLTSFGSHKHLVFYGPSGGGFAALYYSSRFPGSLAIPVNPQTDIDDYAEEAVKSYCTIAWGTDAGASVPAVTDLRPQYSGEIPNHVLYLQNLGDRAHINQQLIPFLNSVSEKHKVLIHLGKWGIGHRAPSPEIQSPFIEAAVQVKGDWAQLTDLIETLEGATPVELKELATEYTLLEKRALHRKSQA